jgi:hypothetical protein
VMKPEEHMNHSTETRLDALRELVLAALDGDAVGDCTSNEMDAMPNNIVERSTRAGVDRGAL